MSENVRVGKTSTKQSLILHFYQKLYFTNKCPENLSFSRPDIKMAAFRLLPINYHRLPIATNDTFGNQFNLNELPMATNTTILNQDDREKYCY